MIRTHLDLHVDEGEEGKLATILSDPDVLKQVGNFLVNVALTKKDEATGFKVSIVGGAAHTHEGNRRTSCGDCIALSSLLVFREF